MQRRASEKAAPPAPSPRAPAPKASVADRMAALQKKASFRAPVEDAAPPAKRAPSTSVAERMAAMQRKASEAAAPDAAPAAEAKTPRQSGGIKARLAAMGGGVPMMGMPGMAPPRGMPGMGGPPPPALARSKSTPEVPPGPAGELTHATMARAKAPKRRPKTASFDPKMIGQEFEKLEAIEGLPTRSMSAPDAARPKSMSDVTKLA